MNEKENLCVSGFVFETQEAAQKAKDELSGIDIVRSKMNIRNPQTVLEVYNKLIDKRLCKTPVGYSYLHDLQKYLQNSASISKEEIRDIPIEPIRRKVVDQFQKPAKEKEEGTGKKYKERYQTSIFINLILAIAVVIVLFLATTSGTPNMINYENNLIDKYESWEQELTERETAVKEQEKLYHITP